MATVLTLANLVLIVLALLGKRWAYIVFVAIGLLRIPARTGFQLQAPACTFALSLDGAWQSLFNWPHIVLFGLFFLMTRAQFPNARHALLLAGVATLTFGAIIELQQGVTRTGNCETHDLIPDAVGAVIAGAAVTGWEAFGSFVKRRRSTTS